MEWEFNYIILFLRITFVVLFVKELILLDFKRKQDKWIWFLVVLLLGFFGYCIYLAYRRSLIIKRKFNPIFKSSKLHIVSATEN